MGTACAWCETVLNGSGTSAAKVSHTICPGCLEQLRATLSSAGLRLSEPAHASAQGTQPTA
jgi:hypothetical protein